jgi:site-specific DNA-adenine methylase
MVVITEIPLKKQRKEPSSWKIILAASSMVFLAAFILHGSFWESENFKETLLNAKDKVLSFFKPSYVPADGVFTTDYLKQFDGTDPSKPLFLAMKGHVFDVTLGKRHYGKVSSF